MGKYLHISKDSVGAADCLNDSTRQQLITSRQYISSSSSSRDEGCLNWHKHALLAIFILLATWTNPVQAVKYIKNVDLASMTNATGFKMLGTTSYGWAGYSVNTAGDVNGDGLNDMIIGEPYTNTAYVVFGRPNGILFTNFNLGAMVTGSTTGFRIKSSAGGSCGWAVSGAGDFNGDGFKDVIVGAPQYSPGGAAFVVFGRNSSNPRVTDIDVSTMVTGRYTGFKVFGTASGEYIGSSVSGIGDINGDGMDDIMVGAQYYNNFLGGCFIFFGSKVTSTATAFKNINVGSYATGFQILASSTVKYIGWTSSRAGDVNGDGISDIIISGQGVNTAHIVFGRNVTKTKQPLMSFNMIDWVTNFTTGFRLVLDQQSINSVSSAGDVNGDGISDVIVGAPRIGKSYIVFGRAVNRTTMFADINLATFVTGMNTGFRVINAGTYISSMNEPDPSGMMVSAAGDVNGDGIGDIIVGAQYGDPPNIGSVTRTNGGISYVIFGRRVTSTANQFTDLDVSTYVTQMTIGFSIFGVHGNAYSGGSVSSAGDLNNDGYADVIVGSFKDKGTGVPGNENGAAYVIYGGDFINTPSSAPTPSPSRTPSYPPTRPPTRTPSARPTSQPSRQPSSQPSAQPTARPSSQPSSQPSTQPSLQPNSWPSAMPTGQPLAGPTSQPSTQPSAVPSTQPSSTPSRQPSSDPSTVPTSAPSMQPSAQPNAVPSSQPSSQPSVHPSSQPSVQPSLSPSVQPSARPSAQPSAQPSVHPTTQPSHKPSTQPSSQPSVRPTDQPKPTSQPSTQPTVQPVARPTSQPSLQPTSQPSRQPTAMPTSQPSSQPSLRPSAQPTSQPSKQPSSQPTNKPTVSVAMPTGEWATSVANATLATVTLVGEEVWACGASSASSITNTAACVILDANSGALHVKYSFAWDTVISVTTIDATNTVFISGRVVGAASTTTNIGTCTVEQAELTCTVKSFLSTNFLDNSYSPFTKYVLYVGGSGVYATATVIDGTSVAKERNYYYTSTNMKSVTLLRVASPTNFLGSMVAGTGVSVSSANYIVAGWIQLQSGDLSAMYLSPVTGSIRSSVDLVTAMALETVGPDSFIIGGIALSTDSLGACVYLLRANALYRSLQYTVRYRPRAVVGGRRSLRGVSAAGSVGRGLVRVGNSLYIIADHTTTQAHANTSLVVIQAATLDGSISRQVTVSSQNASIYCTDIILTSTVLNIACTVYYAQGGQQAVVMSVDQTLSFTHLPRGFVRSGNNTFYAESVPLKATYLPTTKQSTTIDTTDSTFVSGNQVPTLRPSTAPSVTPSTQPSSAPSTQPSSSPTAEPTVSAHPTSQPSTSGPTKTYRPVSSPTAKPTGIPTVQPSVRPTVLPVPGPSVRPTRSPSAAPSSGPTVSATTKPSAAPTAEITQRPTASPTARPSRAAPTVPPSAVSVYTNVDANSNSNDQGNTVVYAVLGGVGGAICLLFCGSAMWKVYKHRTDMTDKKKRKIAYRKAYAYLHPTRSYLPSFLSKAELKVDSAAVSVGEGMMTTQPVPIVANYNVTHDSGRRSKKSKREHVMNMEVRAGAGAEGVTVYEDTDIKDTVRVWSDSDARVQPDTDQPHRTVNTDTAVLSPDTSIAQSDTSIAQSETSVVHNDTSLAHSIVDSDTSVVHSAVQSEVESSRDSDDSMYDEIMREGDANSDFEFEHSDYEEYDAGIDSNDSVYSEN